MEIRTIGIDLGKTVFHVIGLNGRGEVVVRKQVDVVALTATGLFLQFSGPVGKQSERG